MFLLQSLCNFFFPQNFPARSAPIKEQTVLEYLLEAAQEGCELDWTRLCHEVGLIHEMFSDIQSAILKVGSKERLKPIKNELPEDVSLQTSSIYLRNIFQIITWITLHMHSHCIFLR